MLSNADNSHFSKSMGYPLRAIQQTRDLVHAGGTDFGGDTTDTVFHGTPANKGSSSLLVQNRGRRERQDASAKQFKSGSAIHLALQCLQSIDVTFDRSEEHTSELQSLRHLVCR